MRKLYPDELAAVKNRFRKWDPFFGFVGVQYVGVTVPAKSSEPSAKTAASIMFDTGAAGGSDIVNRIPKKWFEKRRDIASWKLGEFGIFLKMIPVEYKSKSRADTHLWPKGTFLQVKNLPVRLAQRSQQSHDARLWKGQSKMLDMTSMVDPSEKTFVQLLCHDEEPYYFMLGFVRYESVDSIYDQLLSTSSLLPFITYEKSLVRAKQKANAEVLTVDSDDDQDGSEESLGKFIFSLVCPLSRHIMETPVRGQHCRHFQVRNSQLLALFMAR